MTKSVEKVETFFDVQGPPEIVEAVSKIAAGVLLVWLSTSELLAEWRRYRKLHS